MERTLKDINAVMGVTGCFVCNDEGEILAGVLPTIFDEAMLSVAGRTATQTIAGMEAVRRKKIGDIDLFYKEGRLIVKNLQKGCLCILCVRNINIPLLNLTANVAAKKLVAMLKEPKDKSPQVAIKPPPKKLSPVVAAQVSGEIKRTLPEAPPYDVVGISFFAGLERELINAIGPIGPVIINDEIAALGLTRESFPRHKVAELAEQLSFEIDEGRQRVRFQQVILNMLKDL